MTHYAFARTLGLHYGPAFRSVAVGLVPPRRGLGGDHRRRRRFPRKRRPPLLHPAYLDGAFQLLADLALRESGDTPMRRSDLPAFLPVRIDRLELLQPHARGRLRALAAPADSERRSRRSMRADFTLYDACDAPIAIAAWRPLSSRRHSRGRGAARRVWIATRAVPMPRATRSAPSRCQQSTNSHGAVRRACMRPSGWRRAGASAKSSNRCSMHCAPRLPPAGCGNSPAISRSSRGR